MAPRRFSHIAMVHTALQLHPLPPRPRRMLCLNQPTPQAQISYPAASVFRQQHSKPPTSRSHPRGWKKSSLSNRHPKNGIIQEPVPERKPRSTTPLWFVNAIERLNLLMASSVRLTRSSYKRPCSITIPQILLSKLLKQFGPFHQSPIGVRWETKAFFRYAHSFKRLFVDQGLATQPSRSLYIT